jgi:hypothetical protein
VEQVKGTEEMKQNIIAAAKRAQDDYYQQELLHLTCTCDKYLNNYRHNHSKGILYLIETVTKKVLVRRLITNIVSR